MLPPPVNHSSHLSYQKDYCGIGFIVLVFKSPLFDLQWPESTRVGDAGNPDMPKESREVLPLSEKVCIYRKKHSI